MYEEIEFDFWECGHEQVSQKREDGEVKKFVNSIKHERVFHVFHPGFEEHISKKCPINGQNLTKYSGYFIQLMPGILLQLEVLKYLHHQQSVV